MEDLLDYLKQEMAASQAKYKDDTNRHREPTPTFNKDDKVWLDARNIQIKRPSRKLDWKNLGRFKIKYKISSQIYKLELLDTIQIYSIFYVLLLISTAIDPLSGQIIPKAQPIEVDGDISQKIKEIYNSKQTKGGWVQYLVKQVRTDAPTWEKASNLTNYNKLLDIFHRLYPAKPNRRILSRRAQPNRGEE